MVIVVLVTDLLVRLISILVLQHVNFGMFLVFHFSIVVRIPGNFYAFDCKSLSKVISLLVILVKSHTADLCQKAKIFFLQNLGTFAWYLPILSSWSQVLPFSKLSWLSLNDALSAVNRCAGCSIGQWWVGGAPRWTSDVPSPAALLTVQRRRPCHRRASAHDGSSGQFPAV